ncbi:hypothetical protein BKH46_04395 [Helicobacter sp. 12S02634-8]|uniref:phosphatase PAP2 family protein n=1 Tax=Helicobacter sp. 12S02634-8 TaxID=1476199 RepID=UPI000BA70422|nr:phosphatase PAP2 family protein [Helicobacter sp. 12S02634-8]PAF47328.1 hypothetical protein BKH46_04395 [Helicobacter sp. 12S02634-8]
MAKKSYVLLGISGVLLVLFLWEMAAVFGGATWVGLLDTSVIASVRGGMDPLKTSILKLLTHLGSTKLILVMTLLVVGGLFYRRRFLLGAWFGGSMVIGGVLLKALKEIIHRPRPPAYEWLIEASGYSYPSGHSLGSALFYGLIGLLFVVMGSQKIWLKVLVGLLCLLFILLMMYARVYLGVHFPTDVLGGFLLGGFLCFLSLGLYGLFFKTS